MTPQLAVAGVVADPDFARRIDRRCPRPAVNTAVALTLKDSLRVCQRLVSRRRTQASLLARWSAFPNVQCQSVSSARSQLEGAGFHVVVQQFEVPSTCKAGSVAGTDPTGSTCGGGPVAIHISNARARRRHPARRRRHARSRWRRRGRRWWRRRGRRPHCLPYRLVAIDAVDGESP